MTFVEIHKELYSVLPFMLTSVGHRKQEKVNRRVGFDSHHFLWILKGSGKFRIQDECFTLKSGEGIFMRENIPHSYEGNDFYTAYITFTMSKKMLDYLGVGEWFRFDVPNFLDRDFEQLCRFVMGNSTILSRSSAGYPLVMDLFSSVLAKKDTPVMQIQQLLEHRYHEALTLDEIASVVNMDRFSLCRYYMAERGITVMDELLRIRIEKAKRFLKYNNDPIQKVGKMCGFESPSYFGKRFREMVGCTPLEYRKRQSESVIR